MTKRDLVIQVAAKLGLTQNEVALIVQESLDAITETLVEGKRLEIRNFGVFEIKERDARIGRNPRTGEEVPIPQKKVASFRPGKTLKEWVQAGAGHRPEHLFREGDGAVADPQAGIAASVSSGDETHSPSNSAIQTEVTPTPSDAQADERQSAF